MWVAASSRRSVRVRRLPDGCVQLEEQVAQPVVDREDGLADADDPPETRWGCGVRQLPPEQGEPQVDGCQRLHGLVVHVGGDPGPLALLDVDEPTQ